MIIVLIFKIFKHKWRRWNHPLFLVCPQKKVCVGLYPNMFLYNAVKLLEDSHKWNIYINIIIYNIIAPAPGRSQLIVYTVEQRGRRQSQQSNRLLKSYILLYFHRYFFSMQCIEVCIFPSKTNVMLLFRSLFWLLSPSHKPFNPYSSINTIFWSAASKRYADLLPSRHK